MNSKEIFNVIEEIAKTSSKNSKKEILKKYKDDPDFIRVLYWTLNPYLTFGVKLKPKDFSYSKNGGNIPEDKFVHFFEFLDKLSERKLTGNAAREVIAETLSKSSEETATLIFRVLNKDLRFGMSAKSVNDVIKIIPEFEIGLAHLYDPKRIKSFPVAIEPKLDGFRLIANIEYNGDIRTYSRSGKVYTSFSSLSPLIYNMVKSFVESINKSYSHYDDFHKIINGSFGSICLDGEVLSGSFNETASQVSAKDKDAKDSIFYIFDIFNLHDNNDVPYKVRKQIISDIVSHSSTDRIKYLDYEEVNSLEEIQDRFEKHLALGLEGIIVKTIDGVYTKGKTHVWQKVKEENTEDVRIVDRYEGEGKYVGMLGGFIVDYNGVLTKIGGGFTDVQRSEFWNCGFVSLRGRMIEVKFQEETPDGSIRHSRFIKFRDDKENSDDA